MLVRRISKELHKPEKDILPIVNAVFDQIIRSVLDGHKVTISSLGSFRLRECRERKGYDPYRRRHILVPAGRTIRFTVSPALQKRISMRCRQNNPDS